LTRDTLTAVKNPIIISLHASRGSSRHSILGQFMN
jgi:hypothetical protein